MKYEITQKGVYGADGEAIPVGGIVEVKGDTIPGWLVNKAVPAGGRVAITNPATGGLPKAYEDMTRAELDALAAERKVDIKDAKNKGDVIAALELADEAAKQPE